MAVFAAHYVHLYTTQTIGLLTFSAVVVTIVYGQGKLLYDFPTILWLMLHILFLSFHFVRFLLLLYFALSPLSLPVRYITLHRMCLFNNSFPLLFAFLLEKSHLLHFSHETKSTLTQRIFFQLTLFKKKKTENIIQWILNNQAQNFTFLVIILMTFLRKLCNLSLKQNIDMHIAHVVPVKWCSCNFMALIFKGKQEIRNGGSVEIFNLLAKVNISYQFIKLTSVFFTN